MSHCKSASAAVIAGSVAATLDYLAQQVESDDLDRDVIAEYLRDQSRRLYESYGWRSVDANAEKSERR